MANREVCFVVDDEYTAWIANKQDNIKHSQIKASVKVNYELPDLYWDIGRDIDLFRNIFIAVYMGIVVKNRNILSFPVTFYFN